MQIYFTLIVYRLTADTKELKLMSIFESVTDGLNYHSDVVGPFTFLAIEWVYGTVNTVRVECANGLPMVVSRHYMGGN
jgi:hypothetical protein